MTVPAIGMALLDAIAHGETRGDYALQYGDKPGNGSINDYSSHPGMHKGHSAAGRYQFLTGTWASEAKKLGLKDFSPKNQDEAAWDVSKSLYKSKTGRDLEADLESGGHMTKVIKSLRGTWPSLPGGTQQVTDRTTFDNVFSKASEIRVAESAPSKTAAQGTSALGAIDMLAPPTELKSRSVHTVPIDPITGSPIAEAYGDPTDYQSSDVQHGNNATADQLDNPGPVISPDLDPFMNAAIQQIASRSGTTVTGDSNSTIKQRLDTAKDSTYSNPEGIRVTQINPNGTDKLTGIDILNPVEPYKPLPSPAPLVPSGQPDINPPQLGGSGNASAGSSAGGSGNVKHNDNHDSNKQSDSFHGWEIGGVTIFGPITGDGAPYFTDTGRNSNNRDSHVSENTHAQPTSGAIKTKQTTYVKPDGSEHVGPRAGDAGLPPKVKPYLPQLPVNSSGSPDDRDSTVQVAPPGIASLGLSIAAGVDPILASQAHAVGIAPTVKPIAVPKPLISTTHESHALPIIEIPKVTLASGKTVPVTATGTSQGGRYEYETLLDGSVLNKTTGRVTAPASNTKQNTTRGQQANNDLRESGMIDNFGMPTF